MLRHALPTHEQTSSPRMCSVLPIANLKNHKMLVNHDHIKDMIGTSYRIADFKRPHGTNLLEVQDINFAKERTRTNPFLCFASIFKFVTCGSLNFGVADMSDSCAQHPPFPFNLRFWQFDTIWTLMKMIENFRCNLWNLRLMELCMVICDGESCATLSYLAMSANKYVIVAPKLTSTRPSRLVMLPCYSNRATTIQWPKPPSATRVVPGPSLGHRLRRHCNTETLLSC